MNPSLTLRTLDRIATDIAAARTTWIAMTT